MWQYGGCPQWGGWGSQGVQQIPVQHGPPPSQPQQPPGGMYRGNPPAGAHYGNNASLDLIHSMAGGWVVSDAFPVDDTFTGLKIYADGLFICKAGTIKSGKVVVHNTSIREVHLLDGCGSIRMVFSVTPDGMHMAGVDVHTQQTWHLEKMPTIHPTSVQQSQASSSKKSTSDLSSSSSLTQQKLRDIINRAWKAGRASAEDRSSQDNEYNAGLITAEEILSESRVEEEAEVLTKPEIQPEKTAAHCPVFGRVPRRRYGSSQTQRSLCRSVVNSKDAEAITKLLEATRRGGVDPNSVCLSTAAHRVARLNGPQEIHRNTVFEFIVADITTHGLTGWDAQALSKLLWAFSTAGFQNTELFGAAEDYIQHEGLSQFRSQHLAYLVWAYATCNLKNSGLFDQVSKEIVNRGASSFNSQDICMTIRGFISSGHRNLHAVRITEAEIGRRGFQEFNPHETAHILWSLASAALKCHALIPALSNFDEAKGFTLQTISMAIRAVAIIASHHEDTNPFVHFASKLEKPTLEQCARSGFQGSYLSGISWGLVKLGMTESPVLPEIESCLSERGLKGLSGSELASVSWAFEKYAPTSVVINEVCAEVIKRGGVQQNGGDLHTMLTSLYACCGTQRFTAVFNAIAKGLTTRRLRYLKDGELFNVVKIIHSAGCFTQTLKKKISAEICRRGMKLADTALLRDACWVFDGKHEVISVVASEVDRRPTRLYSPEELSIVFWGLAQSDYQGTALKCLSEAAKRPASAFSPLQLANIVSATMTIGADPTAILRNVEIDVNTRGFASYGSEAFVIALLFMGSIPPPQHNQWQAVTAWIPLPPSRLVNKNLLAALENLGHKPETKAVVGTITYAVALPDLKVVVKEDVPSKEFYRTNAVNELTRRALRYEGWHLIVVSHQESVEGYQAMMESSINEWKKTAPTVVDLFGDEEEEEEEGSSDELQVVR